MEAAGKTLAAWAASVTWQDLPHALREKALDHMGQTWRAEGRDLVEGG